MLQALIGPLTELAGGWIKGKAYVQAADAKLNLTEAEAKEKIMLSWLDHPRHASTPPRLTIHLKLHIALPRICL